MEFRYQCRAAFLAMEIDRLLEREEGQRLVPNTAMGELDFDVTLVEDIQPARSGSFLKREFVRLFPPTKPLAVFRYRTVTEGDTKLIVDVFDKSVEERINKAIEGTESHRAKLPSFSDLVLRVSATYSPGTSLWWESIATWYWSGGRDGIRQEDMIKIVDELDVRKIELKTLQHNLTKYKPEGLG